jgi:hypothetical protein
MQKKNPAERATRRTANRETETQRLLEEAAKELRAIKAAIERQRAEIEKKRELEIQVAAYRTTLVKEPDRDAAQKTVEERIRKMAELGPLTITLAPDAAAMVRLFADHYGEREDDVASGLLADTLPQALEEIERGRGTPDEHFQYLRVATQEARRRRRVAIAKAAA